MENPYTALQTQIEDELTQYLTGVVNLPYDPNYSMPKLIRRISLFENHIYPSGKFDSQKNYKFWFDIQTPRINAEVKNIDFDTKDIEIYSPRKIDALPCIISNLALKEHLRKTGQAEQLNSAIEEGSGWGNAVWKKVKKGYERVDLKNFYVINQTAEYLRETPVIERHQMSQSDLKGYSGVYDIVKLALALKDCKSESYSNTIETQGKDTTVPYYDVFERNGEVCLADLKKENGETIDEGDEDKYVLAKVVAIGTKTAGGGSGVKLKYILYADTLKGGMDDLYKEYHRGRYKGRWWREGIIEMLFDLQVRANQIGNQLAQGLEWTSKTIFSSDDKLIVQNILTDLKNGDVIRAKGLQQVPVVMQGYTELANEWNRILALADSICNSMEIVQGETMPSTTPFRLGALINQNANKLYDFIREKFSIPMSQIFEKWIVPELINDLKAQDVLRIVGDSDMIDRLLGMIVDSWYVDNLIAIGPHTNEIRDTLKQVKMEELKSRPQLLMNGLESVWKGFIPNVSVDITGENLNLDSEIQTLATFIQLELDPIRRTALIEMAMKKKGVDVGAFPKTPPAPPTPPAMPGAMAPQALPPRVFVGSPVGAKG